VTIALAGSCCAAARSAEASVRHALQEANAHQKAVGLACRHSADQFHVVLASNAFAARHTMLDKGQSQSSHAPDEILERGFVVPRVHALFDQHQRTQWQPTANNLRVSAHRSAQTGAAQRKPHLVEPSETAGDQRLIDTIRGYQGVPHAQRRRQQRSKRRRRAMAPDFGCSAADAATFGARRTEEPFCISRGPVKLKAR
jgi:hypothetical protein